VKIVQCRSLKDSAKFKSKSAEISPLEVFAEWGYQVQEESWMFQRAVAAHSKWGIAGLPI